MANVEAEALTIGPYRLTGALGRGSMADVLRGIHEVTGQPAALKIIHRHLADQPEYLARFEREAEIMHRLDHPHIARLFGTYEVEGRPALALDYLPGGTLEDRFNELRAQGARMTIGEVLEWLPPIADAVDVAHQQGVIHRDLKPSNILFRTEDLRDPVLTDFGLSFVLGAPRISVHQGVMGTPAYISPEHGRGAIGDSRSDLYSLAVIVYEALVGRPPFEGLTMAVVMKHISEPPPAPRLLGVNLPGALESALLKALSKDPAQRYATATLFVRAMRQAADGGARPIAASQTVPVKAGDRTKPGGAPKRLWIGNQQPRRTEATPARPQRRRPGEASPAQTAVMLVVAGAVFAALGWWGANQLTAGDSLPSAPARFGRGANVVVRVEGGTSTSVTRGCPGPILIGVVGVAADGMRARVLDRRVCNGTWWYEVDIHDENDDNWDGVGWVDGSYLAQR
jgi:hypothetical protein